MIFFSLQNVEMPKVNRKRLKREREKEQKEIEQDWCISSSLVALLSCALIMIRDLFIYMIYGKFLQICLHRNNFLVLITTCRKNNNKKSLKI